MRILIIEGLDRSGKSTLVNSIKQAIDPENEGKVAVYGFPDRSTPIGKIINSTLKGEISIPNEAVDLLFIANRLEIWNEIYKKLEDTNVKLIVIDRFLHSGVAYGLTRGTSLVTLLTTSETFIGPNIVELFIDITAEECATREDFGEEVTETLAFQKKVYENYKASINVMPWTVYSMKCNKETTKDVMLDTALTIINTV